MAAPLTPSWIRPSHPDVQHVIINESEFTSKSHSKVALPPFGLFAKMAFPPCTLATGPTYATVQIGLDKHLNLNSDLLYINHSCEPSLIFDTGNLNILAGPKGLEVGEELTFFYPSSEWFMAQPFDCLCGKSTCRGRIAGARDMTDTQLRGLWLNGHIRQLLEERKAIRPSYNGSGNSFLMVNGTKRTLGNGVADKKENNSGRPEIIDQTAEALREALKNAEKVVEAAQYALNSYVQGKWLTNGALLGVDGAAKTATASSLRRGPTSRELSGEMGGDTSVSI
ncbi:hypothetical protein B0H67DRAFT_497973 [Lasiosphaeris hirsuta]|uniref:Post-SET domain-containing protein n=1 Tax=Lasiosphaeris hirsuta TaxID=260670 RepID=A0AA40DMI7_9PEZI|nr:hypothetical protein B0H67DRAFT_497973 [Lasiosphaeris hirsuta]